MPKTKQKNKRKAIDKLLSTFGLVATIALLAIGGLAWWAYSFTSSTVHSELAEQKIYFPQVGSTALTSLPSTDQGAVSRYAGQQVLNGDQAKVFANNYIAIHLSEVAGGKTYSQISAESLAQPDNAQLKAQAQTRFQGETLRGLLLGDAYAFWTVGHIAQIAAIVCFIAGAVMAVLTLLGFWHLSTLG